MKIDVITINHLPKDVALDLPMHFSQFSRDEVDQQRSTSTSRHGNVGSPPCNHLPTLVAMELDKATFS